MHENWQSLQWSGGAVIWVQHIATEVARVRAGQRSSRLRECVGVHI